MDKKTKSFIPNLKVGEIVPEGKCISKHLDKVIFVEFGAPGDIIDLQITKDKRKYTEGRPARIIEPSPYRIEPFCEHFGTCGGCKWQHVTYDKQAEAKHAQVVDQLERFGKTSPVEILPILGSAKTKYYRNKLEFSFTNRRWLTEVEIEHGGTYPQRNGLGYHLPGRFDRILDIQNCYLQTETTNELRNWTKQYALDKGLAFYDHINQNGFLRSMVLRTTTTGQLMVIIQFGEQNEQQIIQMLEDLQKAFPQITSLNYVVNLKKNITFADLPVVNFAGKDHITEAMGHLNFKIGPKSFYQTNPEQAHELYKVVSQFAGLSGQELVYDLYTGTGTIAIFLADKCKHVVGIEYVEEAVGDAWLNAELNGVKNVEFHAGDIKEYMKETFFTKTGLPDVVITDPPRTGMHEDVLYGLMYLAPKRIVYVSCSPITQARDMLILREKYTATKCQPVDMFPHTSHVENVLLLERTDLL